jgi:hypothetical protein
MLGLTLGIFDGAGEDGKVQSMYSLKIEISTWDENRVMVPMQKRQIDYRVIKQKYD